MDFEKVDEHLMKCNVGELMYVLQSDFKEKGQEGKKSAMEKAFRRIEELLRNHQKRKEMGAQNNGKCKNEDPDFYTLQKGLGCVLMMSNSFKGSNEMSRVRASTADLNMMSKLWKKIESCELFSGEDDGHQQVEKAFIDQQIGCKCVYEDLDGDRMEDLLKQLSETKKDYSYIVVYISSHGGRMSEARVKDYKEGKRVGNEKSALDDFKECAEKGTNGASPVQVFLGNGKKPVREDRMLELFHNHKNKKLDGIPKFFILDYCRSVPQSKEIANAKAHGIRETEETGMSVSASLPIMSDILILNATHDYFLAYDCEMGSKLTKSLYGVFMENENYKHKEAVDMLTMVNARMKKESSKTEAMSSFESSLDKKFYFVNQPKRLAQIQLDHKRLIPPKQQQTAKTDEQ